MLEKEKHTEKHTPKNISSNNLGKGGIGVCGTIVMSSTDSPFMRASHMGSSKDGVGQGHIDGKSQMGIAASQDAHRHSQSTVGNVKGAGEQRESQALHPSNLNRYTHRKLKNMPFWVPNPWVRRGSEEDDDFTDTFNNVISYDLSWYQRLFVTLEYPNSCKAGRIYQVTNIIVVTMSVLMTYFASQEGALIKANVCDVPACIDDQCNSGPCPGLCPNTEICAPIPRAQYQIADFWFCLFYAIDLGSRLFAVPFMSNRVLRIVPAHWDIEERKKPQHEQRGEPTYGMWEKLWRWQMLLSNLIDAISTVPYWIILIYYQSTSPYAIASSPWLLGSTNSILLTVRIARCFRLLKILDLHPQGSPKLTIIIRTVRDSFSSLLILLGFVGISAVIFGSLIYTFEKGDFIVNAEYPEGAFLRQNLTEQELEVSPFFNLGRSMYWAIVTMSTLGYGDLYPTTTVGRFIGGFCAVYGVLVISLPVTIINNAFGEQLKIYEASSLAEKAKIALLASKNKQNLNVVGAFKSSIKSELEKNITSMNTAGIEAETETETETEKEKEKETGTRAGAIVVYRKSESSNGMEVPSVSLELSDFIDEIPSHIHMMGCSKDDSTEIVSDANLVELTKIKSASSGLTTLPEADNLFSTKDNEDDDDDDDNDVKSKSGDDRNRSNMNSNNSSINKYNEDEIIAIMKKIHAAKDAIKALESVLYKHDFYRNNQTIGEEVEN